MRPHAFAGLMERRIPQIVGGYLAVSWGVVEFVNFLEGRFLFSPHWTNLVLVGLGLLLPSVALLAWNHGRAGKDQFLRTEKIGIPANVLGAAAVLFLTFGGKDLGAVTMTVVVEDESGAEVERVVPKSEFRSRMAMFHFTPSEDDASDLWLGLGEALRMDLYQDMFLEIVPPLVFWEELKEAGFEDPASVPFQLKRQVAGDRNLEYLLDGEVARDGDTVVATVRVHEVERGRAVLESTVRAADLFEAADSLSLAIRRALGVPTAHIEGSPDLPARDMFTSSDAAFDHFVAALRAMEFDDDWAATLAGLEEAVAEDPSFAIANFNLYVAAIFSQQIGRARAAIDAAKQHAYRLPERTQYDVRYSWYYARQELEQAIRVLEAKAELFPQDVQAHEQLAMMSQFQGDREAAIRRLERVLELAPAKTEHLQSIASLYLSMGDFERSLEYLERYAETHPDDADSYTELGDVYRRMGRLEEAREQYERAAAVDDDPALLVPLARVERATGDFDAALARLERRLDAAGTPAARVAALDALGEHWAYLGRMTRAVESYEEAISILAAIAPPLAILDRQSEVLDLYVHAGRAEDAQRILASITAQLEPPLDVLAEFMTLELAIAMEDPATARAAAQRAERAFELFPLEGERASFLELLGQISELEGACQAAIEQWRMQADLDPTNPMVPSRIGRCHRKLGDLPRAREEIERTLALVPSHPRARFELALVLDGMGDRAGAVRELERAMEAWAEADDSYAVAREARETLSRWRGGATEG